MTAAALRLLADERDLYVTEPAATPRTRWNSDSEPVNWSALASPREQHRDPPVRVG